MKKIILFLFLILGSGTIRPLGKLFIQNFNKIEKKFFRYVLRNCSEISSEEIIKGYYYIKRMTPALKLLEDLETKGILNLKFLYKMNEKEIVIEELVFFQQNSKELILSVVQNNSINPLEDIWEDFLRYRYIDNEKLLKEIGCFFVFILKRAAENFKCNSVKKIKLQDLQYMSLEEVLDILDILIDELPAFIEKYELDSEMEWGHWLRKYWLLAPIAFIALILKIYLGSNNQSVT